MGERRVGVDREKNKIYGRNRRHRLIYGVTGVRIRGGPGDLKVETGHAVKGRASNEASFRA